MGLAQWGSPVDDLVIRQLVQRLGQKAEEKIAARLKTNPREREPKRAGVELAVLMNDG
jgi:hypothetical protein